MFSLKFSDQNSAHSIDRHTPRAARFRSRLATFAIVATLGFAAAVSSAASGAESLALPGDLQATMKEMNIRMKTIAGQATDAAKNAESAKLASEFAALSEHAKGFVPDTVASLPAAQKAAQLAIFQAKLSEVTTAGHDLAQAFKDGNSSRAVQLLQTLAAEKKAGHDQFK